MVKSSVEVSRTRLKQTKDSASIKTLPPCLRGGEGYKANQALANYLTNEAPTIDLLIARLVAITALPIAARYSLSTLNSLL